MELSSQAVMMKQMVQRFHLKDSASFAYEPDHGDSSLSAMPSLASVGDENRFSKY